MAHVTIAVSGARGGHTVDFRDLAAAGITLVGRADSYENGAFVSPPTSPSGLRKGMPISLCWMTPMLISPARGWTFPEEPEARELGPLPSCVTNPLQALDLKAAGISAIVWATGYELDFGWIKPDIFDDKGQPRHKRGISGSRGCISWGSPGFHAVPRLSSGASGTTPPMWPNISPQSVCEYRAGSCWFLRHRPEEQKFCAASP